MTRRRHHLPDDDVPRLPRGRGLALSSAGIIRIVMVAVTLIAVLVLTKPCADATSKFVTGFDDTDAGVKPVDAGAAATPPPPRGTLLRADMTPEELKAAIEQEQAGAATGSGSAAGSDAGAGTGSVAPPR